MLYSQSFALNALLYMICSKALLSTLCSQRFALYDLLSMLYSQRFALNALLSTLCSQRFALRNVFASKNAISILPYSV
jgi:hypothetical protein